MVLSKMASNITCSKGEQPMFKGQIIKLVVWFALLLSLLGGSGLGSAAAQASTAFVPKPLCGPAAPPCV